MKRLVKWAALVVFAVCAGCQMGAPKGGSPAAWEKIAAGERVRVAVFVDRGARSNGQFRWLQTTALSDELAAFPIDAEMIRKGGLAQADLIIMPGGYSVTEAKTLGKEGREAVRKFIREGGGWIGTCAGAFIACDSTSDHPDMLGIVPYTTWCPDGQADLKIKFTEHAGLIYQKTNSTHRVQYSGGPVMVPRKPDADQKFKTVAVYNANIQVEDQVKRQSMAGGAAMVAGTYGRGRVFVSAVHPEVDPDDHDILRGAFKFVTGRDVTWKLPQRKIGQLALGIVTDDSVGVATGRFVQDLVRSQEFDLTFVNRSAIAEDGVLRHLDALLVPDAAECVKCGVVATEGNKKRLKEFLARGGKVFTWGKPWTVKKLSAYGANVVLAKDSQDALAKVRAFAASPLPKPGFVKVQKVANPTRVVGYFDKGGSCFNVAETLEFSPEFAMEIVNADDIRAGKLAGAKMLVQPGGGCNTQYLNLQKEGQDAIREYVRNGGSYYGICAGAFLATQSVPNRGRLGLVPWKDDQEPIYRGWGKMNIAFTPEGRKELGFTEKERMVLYWGGPVMVPGEPVPDTDIQVFGKYAGLEMNTCQPKPVKPMGGKAAFLGGRVGKGKIFVSAIHPEKHERTYDIVTGAIKYLTGRPAQQVRRDRVRGALAVASGPQSNKPGAEFLVKNLMHDQRFDLRVGDVTDSVLEHVDVVLLLSPEKTGYGSALQAFVKNGGHVIALANTPERKKLVAKYKPGAKIVDSYEAVVAELVALRK